MSTRYDEITKILGTGSAGTPSPTPAAEEQKQTSRRDELYSLLGASEPVAPATAAPGASTTQSSPVSEKPKQETLQQTTPQSALPTAPLTQGSLAGGGGSAAGGGGRGGRADTRANLQRQLNALDEAAAYVTTTEQSDAIEQQRRPIIEQLRQMDEEEGRTGVYTGGDRLKNLFSNALLETQQGLTKADHRIAQTADWLFGGIAKEGRALLNTTLQSINPNWGFENEDPLITQYNKRGEDVIAHNEAVAQKRIEEGRLSPTAWKYAPEVVAAIPDAVLAYLTAGASSGAQATSAGLEAASAAAQAGKAAQTIAPIANATKNMIKNPVWASAFAQTAGSSYEQALAEGATEEEANLYALLNGFANATIEVGGSDEALGGIQKLPKQLREIIKKGDSSRLPAWVKSTGSEVLEESLQGILERGLRTIYSDDVPLYAREDPNAIINPKLMLEEAKGAFITGSLLSGGQAGANAVYRALQTPARVNVDNQTLAESENIAALPEKVTDFPADPGDLETLNQETRLALNQDWDKPEDSPYVDNNSLQEAEQHDTILSNYPLDRSNIVSDGSHINRGKLQPNCTYTSGEHVYIYVTNEESLIKYAIADELQWKEHGKRLPHSRNTPGKQPGDDAGHLFGDLFGGSPKLDNLVSQARNVNRKEFRAIEREWETALRNNQKVSAEIIINYEPGSSRPTEFIINYTIGSDGGIKTVTLKNTNKGG